MRVAHRLQVTAAPAFAPSKRVGAPIRWRRRRRKHGFDPAENALDARQQRREIAERAHLMMAKISPLLRVS